MMHILDPKGNIPSFFFKYGESALILTAVHWTERPGPRLKTI